MAVSVDVKLDPDREQVAAMVAEIRAKVRDAVHAGIADALGDLVDAGEMRALRG